MIYDYDYQSVTTQSVTTITIAMDLAIAIVNTLAVTNGAALHMLLLHLLSLQEWYSSR